MKYNIKEKAITNEFGEPKAIATSITMDITYNPKDDFAIGYFEMFNAKDEMVLTKGNIQIEANGWGENNEFIYNKFATIIGVELEK